MTLRFPRLETFESVPANSVCAHPICEFAPARLLPSLISSASIFLRCRAKSSPVQEARPTPLISRSRFSSLQIFLLDHGCLPILTSEAELIFLPTSLFLFWTRSFHAFFPSPVPSVPPSPFANFSSPQANWMFGQCFSSTYLVFSPLFPSVRSRHPLPVVISVNFPCILQFCPSIQSKSWSICL